MRDGPGTPMKGDGLDVDYFDGLRPLRQTLTLWVQGDDLVGFNDTGEVFRTPRREVHWPHRHQRGQRTLRLPGDAVLYARDAQVWDAWVERHGVHRDTVGWLQAHWASWAATALILVAAAWGLMRWGLPWTAQVVADVLPHSVAQAMGENTLDELRQNWLQPTQLSEATQADWRRRFAEAAQNWSRASDQPLPSYSLHFMGGGTLGPNALALPSGDIIVTDELLDALSGERTVVLGVLAHELTHVREQHVMRQVVQASLLGVLISAITGDFSAIVTTAATWAGASHYSRDFEREADDGAIAFLRANGWSPADMPVLFERLQAARGQTSTQSQWGIAFASHPSDAERVQRFQAAAGR